MINKFMRIVALSPSPPPEEVMGHKIAGALRMRRTTPLEEMPTEQLESLIPITERFPRFALPSGEKAPFEASEIKTLLHNRHPENSAYAFISFAHEAGSHPILDEILDHLFLLPNTLRDAYYLLQTIDAYSGLFYIQTNKEFATDIPIESQKKILQELARRAEVIDPSTNAALAMHILRLFLPMEDSLLETYGLSHWIGQALQVRAPSESGYAPIDHYRFSYHYPELEARMAHLIQEFGRETNRLSLFDTDKADRLFDELGLLYYVSEISLWKHVVPELKTADIKEILRSFLRTPSTQGQSLQAHLFLENWMYADGRPHVDPLNELTDRHSKPSDFAFLIHALRFKTLAELDHFDKARKELTWLSTASQKLAPQSLTCWFPQTLAEISAIAGKFFVKHDKLPEALTILQAGLRAAPLGRQSEFETEIRRVEAKIVLQEAATLPPPGRAEPNPYAPEFPQLLEYREQMRPVIEKARGSGSADLSDIELQLLRIFYSELGDDKVAEHFSKMWKDRQPDDSVRQMVHEIRFGNKIFLQKLQALKKMPPTPEGLSFALQHLGHSIFVSSGVTLEEYTDILLDVLQRMDPEWVRLSVHSVVYLLTSLTVFENLKSKSSSRPIQEFLANVSRVVSPWLTKAMECHSPGSEEYRTDMHPHSAFHDPDLDENVHRLIRALSVISPEETDSTFLTAGCQALGIMWEKGVRLQRENLLRAGLPLMTLPEKEQLMRTATQLKQTSLQEVANKPLLLNWDIADISELPVDLIVEALRLFRGTDEASLRFGALYFANLLRRGLRREAWEHGQGMVKNQLGSITGKTHPFACLALYVYRELARLAVHENRYAEADTFFHKAISLAPKELKTEIQDEIRQNRAAERRIRLPATPPPAIFVPSKIKVTPAPKPANPGIAKFTARGNHDLWKRVMGAIGAIRGQIELEAPSVSVEAVDLSKKIRDNRSVGEHFYEVHIPVKEQAAPEGWITEVKMLGPLKSREWLEKQEIWASLHKQNKLREWGLLTHISSPFKGVYLITVLIGGKALELATVLDADGGFHIIGVERPAKKEDENPLVTMAFKRLELIVLRALAQATVAQYIQTPGETNHRADPHPSEVRTIHIGEKTVESEPQRELTPVAFIEGYAEAMPYSSDRKGQRHKFDLPAALNSEIEQGLVPSGPLYTRKGRARIRHDDPAEKARIIQSEGVENVFLRANEPTVYRLPADLKKQSTDDGSATVVLVPRERSPFISAELKSEEVRKAEEAKKAGTAATAKQTLDTRRAAYLIVEFEGGDRVAQPFKKLFDTLEELEASPELAEAMSMADAENLDPAKAVVLRRLRNPAKKAALKKQRPTRAYVEKVDVNTGFNRGVLYSLAEIGHPGLKERAPTETGK